MRLRSCIAILLWLSIGAAISKDGTAVGNREAAARNGDPHAQFDLGRAYVAGLGVERNYEQAVHWYRLAAESGLAPAQEALAKLYATGRGVERDDALALHWFLQAARAGRVDAQLRLARAYQLGVGCSPSVDEALQWYRLAARQGEPAAQIALADLLRNGRETSAEHEAEAEQWQIAAASAGSELAQYTLGIWYLKGDRVRKDPEAAAAWLRRSAEAGYPSAQHELGRIYWNGHGLPHDPTEAVIWLEAAAASGVEAAANLLGARTRLRDYHLRNARVMDRPGNGPVIVPTPAQIRQGPPGPVSLGMEDEVHCDFFLRDNKGGNPKFRCFMMTGAKTEGGQYYDVFGNVQPKATEVVLFGDGEGRRPVLADNGTPLTHRTRFRSYPLRPLELKIKYRPLVNPALTNHRDVYTEVAATRFLWALGYAVDRMYRVGRVVCHRCPEDPHRASSAAPTGQYETFDNVAIELRYGGEDVETVEAVYDGGWNWRDEIWRLRYGRGVNGFSEAQEARFDAWVVALNLIHHVSGRSRQNRLVCSRARMQPLALWKFCPDTVLLVHDLGSVFAKRQSHSFEAWRDTPMWKDGSSCETSLGFQISRNEDVNPYRIGRAGQLLALQGLNQLTDEHLLAIFESAAFDRFDIHLADPQVPPPAWKSRQIIDGWVREMQAKIEQVRSVTCPVP